jgi:transposase
MGRALSQDLRDWVVAAVEAGMSCRAIAARFGIGVATAARWWQMGFAHGRAIAGKPGGDQRSSKTDAHAEFVMAMLDENGGMALAEIRFDLAARGVKVGICTLWRETVRISMCGQTVKHCDCALSPHSAIIGMVAVNK